MIMLEAVVGAQLHHYVSRIDALLKEGRVEDAECLDREARLLTECYDSGEEFLYIDESLL